MLREHRSKWVRYVIPALAVVGLFDASYLTANHYSGGTVECSLLEGCEIVLSSDYAVLVGIPLALLGALFYLSVFMTGMLVALNEEKQEKILRVLRIFAGVGFAGTLVLIYLQAFVINAWCQFCLLSALLSTLILIFSFLLYRRDEYAK